MTLLEDEHPPVMIIDGEVMLALPVSGMNVGEFTPSGASAPTELHLTLRHSAGDGVPPVTMRFKSRRPVDELVAALEAHAAAVWGPRS